jgi:Uma2 family endonuclease
MSEGPKVVTGQASLFPDVLVSCGPLDLAEDRIREPAVIAEVLSRSTADRDRGAKWVAYRDLPSLRHYLLVAQDRRRVEVYSRADEGWALRIVEPPATVALPAVGVELTLDEIYEDSGC